MAAGRWRNPAGLVVLLPLAGCASQSVQVAAPVVALPAAALPAAPATAAPASAHPCRPPGSLGRTWAAPSALLDRRPELPDRARIERVPGCAGISFRIGADGTAQGAQVVTEYPLGYGFGAAALKAVEASRYPMSEAGPRLFFTVHSLLIR